MSGKDMPEPRKIRTVDEAALEASFASVKGTIGCQEVAELETYLREEADKLRGPCPLPDHSGDSPSFYCYPDDASRGLYTGWHCFRCDRGGDVIDLYAAMFGLEHNLVWAMQGLAERFGLKLWRDTDLMSESQMMARKARLSAERAFNQAIAEHVFERNVMPLIKSVEDDGERAELLSRCLRLAGLGRAS